MDVSYILDNLNDAQRDAVCAPAGHTLVLAGAGSGKTRVLVHRIAWLIQTENIQPHNILAVTFTNKAAAEMRTRIERLLRRPIPGMWVGTFHSLAHRLLRLHWKEANLPESFQILDSDDQFRTMRRVIRSLDLDESRWQPKQLQWYVNACKDEGQRSKHIQHFDDPHQKQMVAIYQAYEELCQRVGLVDFAELLLRSHELWLNSPPLLAHYQQRFRSILVDEFQDTNAIQYAWIRVLAGNQSQTFAVGDDDQSIYGWRGARVENIQQFGQDFAQTKTIRLEQNYRSTGNILAAANALIANNFTRLGKNLWTDDDDGEPIQIYRAFNEQDEARFIVERIQQWHEQGGRLDETAILYRSNAQSRVLEEALIQSAVPYRVYGGLRFFERAEIKDALAYVRLISNLNDDAAFERIVNTPTRGIGDKTIAAIRDHAKNHQQSLAQACQSLIDQNLLSGRASSAIQAFLKLIFDMKEHTHEQSVDEIIDHCIHASGLHDHFSKDRTEKGQGRIENLEELVNAARYFDFEQAETELPPLALFLTHAALEAGDGQSHQGQDCVQLMTMHSAKGLEFPMVFICGVEEGLFPSDRSTEDSERLEEERRLCYVAITRARKHLYMTHAETRRLYGTETYPRPSQFINELPMELINELRVRTHVSTPMLNNSGNEDAQDNDYYLGQRVYHAKFGEGVVINYEGNGPHARIQINFKNGDSKWLVVAYANLQVA